MSYTRKNQESDNASLWRVTIGMVLCCFVFKYALPGSPWLFVTLMIWQYMHMYIIGRKAIGFDNFDGVDLLTGIPVLYFFFTCPGTYILSFGIMYLLTGRRSVRLE